MDPTSPRLATLIILAALVIALGVIVGLWQVRGLSLVSSCLTGIVTFFVSAVTLSLLAAVGAAVTGGGRDRA